MYFYWDKVGSAVRSELNRSGSNLEVDGLGSTNIRARTDLNHYHKSFLSSPL